MADTRAALRLGLAPVLLLSWNMAAAEPLPYLAPSLLVTFLSASPQRPPLRNLAGVLVMVVALTWGLDQLFRVVGDSPFSVWLMFLALAVAAFAHLAQRPGHMPTMLVLICASVVVVIRQWVQGLDLGVAWLMGRAVVEAIIAVLIVHAVLPSTAPDPAASPQRPAERAETLQAFGRGAALVVVLRFALLLEDNSAILVALTAVNTLAPRALTAAQKQGRALLVANSAAAAMVLPLIAVAAIRPDPALLTLLAMAAALWMAPGVNGGGIGRIIAQGGLPVFVILLGVLLPKAGDTALPLLLDRLLTLGVVMLYAIVVLALLGSADSRDGRRAH